MAIRARETETPWLGFYLAGSVFVLLLFGSLFVHQHDWRLAMLAGVGGVSAVVLVRIKLRVRRARAEELEQPLAIADASAQRAFVSRATHMVGASFRRGYVVIGQSTAGFVPMTEWSHLATEIVLGLFATQVSLTGAELVDAIDSPALDAELAALVREKNGLILDEKWSWARLGIALARPDSKGYLTIADAPPDRYVGRWSVLPLDRAVAWKRARKITIWCASIATSFATMGAVTWRITGNADFLIAGLVWAGIIGGAAVAGVLIARRRV